MTSQRSSKFRGKAYFLLRPAVALISLTCLHPASSHTQQTPAPQNPPITFEVGVNRVLVPVVVRDKHGSVVTDLKKDEFKVFANDKPQRISAFVIQKRNNLESKLPNGVSSSTAAPHETSPSASPAQRSIVFLFDDLHLSFGDLSHARTAGARMLDEVLADSDLAAVVTTSGKTNSGLTRDRSKLKDALNNIRTQGLFRPDGSSCPNLERYQADQMENKHNSVAIEAAVQQVFSCDPGLNPQRDHDIAERIAESTATRVLTASRQDVLITYLAIGEFVRRMGTLPGQRTLILVSPGFLRLEADETAAESRIIDIAAQANVTISALDARGLYTTELDASTKSIGSGQMVQLQAEFHRSTSTAQENPMAELADGTGGKYFHNSNDLASGFKSLAEVPECVYVLEIPLDDMKPDGAYHRLKVKVDRDDVSLEARRGFFSPKPEKNRK